MASESAKPGNTTDLSPSGFPFPKVEGMNTSTTDWGAKVGGNKAKTNKEYDSFPVNSNIDPENQGAFGGKRP